MNVIRKIAGGTLVCVRVVLYWLALLARGAAELVDAASSGLGKLRDRIDP